MTKTGKTYGGALYDLAQDEGLQEQILHDLALVLDVFRENPDYLRLLREPSVKKAERISLLDEAWRDSLHLYTLNFLKLLCENDTIGLLSDCEAEYHRRYNEEHGILAVRAVCAVPLKPELRQRLADKLHEKTGKPLELRVDVDERLLGGIRLEMDGQELDGTVRHHLDAISRLLQA